MYRDSHSDGNVLCHHPSIPPVPGLSSVKENRKRPSQWEKEIRFPFHVGSLEWSLKPQSVLALDKEAGFNKYVD